MPKLSLVLTPTRLGIWLLCVLITASVRLLGAQTGRLIKCDPSSWGTAPFACALQSIQLAPLSDPRTGPGGPDRPDRELRFWTFPGLGSRTVLGVIKQWGGSISGQALLIWPAKMAEDSFAIERCGPRRVVSRSAMICDARNADEVDWPAFVHFIDSLGVTGIPSDPVGRKPCRSGQQPAGSYMGCGIAIDFPIDMIEYRSDDLFWSYQFQVLPDTNAPGLPRDKAIQRAWHCISSRMLGGGCRPGFAAVWPGYRYRQHRPMGRDWRQTTGLLPFGTDSLIRTELPPGFREWRIQLGCVGCTPSVVLRIAEDTAGVVRGAAYLLTSRIDEPATDSATALRQHEYATRLDSLRAAHECGYVVRFDWGEIEGCEIGQSIDWGEVLRHARQSGILEALSDSGRIVDPPFQQSWRKPRIDVVPLAGPRLVIDHGPGPCADRPDKELIIEELDGAHYRSASFWCLQRPGETGSAHARQAELSVWLKRVLQVAEDR